MLWEKDLELKWDYGNATGSVFLCGVHYCGYGDPCCECDRSNVLRWTVLVTINEVENHVKIHGNKYRIVILKTANDIYTIILK